MAKDKYYSTEEDKAKAIAEFYRTNRRMIDYEAKEWIIKEHGGSFIKGVSFNKTYSIANVTLRTDNGEITYPISLPLVKM